MKPFARLGACLSYKDVAQHRDWLFTSDRDVEIQDFITPAALTGDWKALAAEINSALDGHKGRRGIHGPFIGLQMDNRDPELNLLISQRFETAVMAAAAIGATQVVLHSPFDAWTHLNWYNFPNFGAQKYDQIEAVLSSAIARAEAEGITLVLENVDDLDPAARRNLAAHLGSEAVKISLDTGHAQLAHSIHNAPPVDYFIKDAGADLAHVHIQDVDGYADRHWAPGDGTILWRSVFTALNDCPSEPRLLLELRDKAEIPRGYAYLQKEGLVG